MQRFVFRLQALLDQKLDLEAKARAAVSEKERKLDEQRAFFRMQLENEKRIEHSIFTAKDDLLLLQAETPGTDIQRKYDYVAALRQDLTAAHEQTVIQKFAVQQAEIHLNEARAYALECSRETKKLMRYRERLEKRFLAESAKKEELEQDELGIAMYLSRRAGS
jgi:flagellar biosynthesis chaperone FliJ